jgi:hypothetical protein
MEKGCITEMSAMVMPPGRTRRMSPSSLNQHAGTQSGGASSPGEPRETAEGGFLVGGNAQPMHNTAQYPFQAVMAQHGVCSKGRTQHSMVSIGRAEGRVTVALHGRGIGEQHADAKVVAKTGRTSLLLSSRALVRGSVSSHAEAGRHAQLRKQRARAICPSAVPALKDSGRAPAWVCAACRVKSLCAAVMVPVPRLTSWYLGGHRVPALQCKAAHWGWSCVPLGPSNGRKVSGPLCMAWWVVAAAARYAALPSDGLEWDRQRPPW